MEEQSCPPRPVLRGSSSYPSMIRARTANRNKITKRNSESSVILTGGGSSMARPTVGGASLDSKKRRHHHPKKKSVYSRVTRRKSLENLGLVVRNRCGTAKLQWPSEKKESDIFDLLPEGCLQVRQLRMKTPKRGSSENLYGSGNQPGRCGWKSSSSYPGRNDMPNLSSHGSQHPESSISGSPPKMDWKSKNSISVIVRIRPKHSRELDDKSIVFRTDPRTVVFDPKEKTKDFYFQGVKQSTRNDFGRKRPNRNVFFQYDKVYGPDSTNRHIFNETLQDLTDHLIEGFNSTVFAYGATGSGKTYTMIGSNTNPGLIVLMVESLYRRIEDLAADYDCDVACSYLEVYNETIKDLLKPEKELYIREDGKKGIIIPELTFYKPRGPNELLRLLRNGNRARTQHATDLNAESSRSHAVFEVKLCLRRKNKGMKDSLDEDEYVPSSEEDGFNKVEVIQSKLVMVDLAGSERGAAATASSGNPAGFFMDTGARQREGSSINKSLLALANCISALADGKCHIPYRNSKLTRLLKDALSGNCTTVMIANISPSNLSSEDTYNTLKYADRAKNIVGPGTKQRNVFLEDLLVEDTSKIQVADLQAKVSQLSVLLEAEKLKYERIIMERREEQDRINSSHSTNINLNVMSRGILSQLGGGDADGLHFLSTIEKTTETENEEELEKKDQQEENSNDEFLPLNNKTVTEDQLPPEILKYMELIKERARVYSEYVQFAADSRLTEWGQSCKKLKSDMADLLGRLPVSDEHYVPFCKLKNEVNNMAMASRSSSLVNVQDSEEKISLPLNTPQNEAKRYAIALKNLTEKLELVRLECVAKNLLLLPDGGYMADSLSIPFINQGNPSTSLISPPAVTISLEEFLQFKRLLGEQEGNDKMEQFYHQFSNQINAQMITSEMTLMHALKLVKKLESLKATTDEKDIARNIQQEFKELSDFVYGPGSEVNPFDSNYPNCLQPTGRPQTTSMSNLGRRSNLILDDLQKLKKVVEQPLLIQLTTLLDTEQYDDDDDGEREADSEDKEGNFENSYNGKELTARKSTSHLKSGHSPKLVMEKPIREMETRSQHNSDFDWYTISGTASTTESSLSIPTSTSASTSAENMVKRESSANNPNQIQTSGQGQHRKQSAGNTKRLTGHHHREQTQPISVAGQLEKSGQESHDEPLSIPTSSTDKSLNPKYTYRLESPSEVMQAFSAAHSVQDNGNPPGESSDEVEDDDDDDSSIEISVSSSIINRGRVSADRQSQISNSRRDNT